MQTDYAKPYCLSFASTSSLKENKIGNEGAQRLADSLEGGTALVELEYVAFNTFVPNMKHDKPVLSSLRDNSIRADNDLEEAFVRLILTNRTLTTIR